ncbi:DsbA family protein [Rubrobacter aplysinae]|uniref:DsbA family protein n=1 Tax=Rubrobacter aplysinae TaxID=909625 RepID=UPI00069CC39E|nr:DsbA family protein [Rubrobacter aplysinae]
MAGDGINEGVNGQPGRGNEELRSGSKAGKGWMMLGGLALAVILATGVAYFALGSANPAGSENMSSGNAGSDAVSAGAAGSDTSRGDTLGPPTLGDEDAPVTMVEYSDFQCPYCGQFAREVEPDLVEEYVKNGTLNIQWRDFPYLGQESVNAALAAREAQEQGSFWEYHEALYENQDSVNSGAFSDDNLKSLAEEVGIDPGKVEESLTSSEHEAAVSRDFEKGQGMGITGTPTFIINGQTIVGAQPKEEFERVIEEAAAQAAEAGISGD